MSPLIFISYRRKDSENATARIHAGLAARFGDANVFWDIKAIPAGAAFPKHVRDCANSCAVMIVVIGPQWHTPRLHGKDDWVRAEVAIGLSRGIHVIPVLLHGASMPPRDELPEALQTLVDHNAFHVHEGASFDTDVAALAGC